MIRTDGLRAFSTSPTPVMVPPVPMPATKASTSPCVSRQISSAVVRRCASGLAGLSNWRGMKLPRIVRSSSCALSTAPRMPSGPGVSTSSAPSILTSLRRSMVIVSGIVRISR